MSMSDDLKDICKQVGRCITMAYIRGYKFGVHESDGSWDRLEAWSKLDVVYQMKGLPDLAYSIIGDVMQCLDVPEDSDKCTE